MAFNLEVTLSGLHLLVPDPHDPARLHALLPATGEAHGHPHNARVRFGDGPYLSLEGFALDLSACRGAGPGTVGFVDEVVNLSPYVPEGLDAAQLGPDPRASVAARVTLPP